MTTSSRSSVVRDKVGSPYAVAAAVVLPLLCSLMLVEGHAAVAVGVVLLVASTALIVLSDFALVATFIVWATFAASLRRLIDYIPGLVDAGYAVYLPLAVLSLIVLARAVTRWRGRAIEFMDIVVAALAVVMIIGLVAAGNPLSGISAGPIALLPLCWYLAGRVLLTPEEVRSLFRLVAALAVVVALVGLAQSFGYFTPFDAAWTNSASFSSLNIGGAIRGFGTMSSPAEYSRYLTVGIVVLIVTPSRHPGGIAYRIAGIAILSTALFYSGVRSGVILLALAILALVMFSRSVSFGRKFVVGIVCVLAAVALFSSEPAPETSDETSGAADAAAQRQIGGLQQPFDEDSSTLTVHITGTINAMKALPTRPVGLGTVSVTPVANEFGVRRPGADGDAARMAGAWGVAGVVVYVMLLVAVARLLLRASRRKRCVLGPLAMGIAIVMLLQWVNVSFYALPPLFWLLMGGLTSELRALSSAASDEDRSHHVHAHHH